MALIRQAHGINTQVGCKLEKLCGFAITLLIKYDDKSAAQRELGKPQKGKPYTPVAESKLPSVAVNIIPDTLSLDLCQRRFTHQPKASYSLLRAA